jgi:hypothetical protein
VDKRIFGILFLLIFTAGCGGSDQPPAAPDMTPAPCAPSCDGKNCGDDGCGGSCGSCNTISTCQDGVCTRKCQPACLQKECGDDGCGGSCGSCGDGICINNLCQCNTTRDCRSGEACFSSTGGGTGCYPTCDAFGTSCPSGQACNTPAVDESGAVFTACGATGDKLEADPCTLGATSGGDCAPGLVCVQRTNGNLCMRLCDPSHACRAGQTCSTLTAGGKTIPWGGCDPPEDACHPDPCTTPHQTVCTLNAGAASCACDSGYMNVGGACQCVPQCSGKGCGPDGCGGSCGTCDSTQLCSSAGQCVCKPQCTGKVCGPDGCGGTCGACGTQSACNSSGQCVCVPNCSGRVCGTDGCGGSCGTCAVGKLCSAGACVNCTPQCSGKACGPDGCGGSCGGCGTGQSCGTSGQCCGAIGGSCTFGSSCCSGICDVNTDQCVSCLASTTTSFCSSDHECCSGLCDTRNGYCVNVCKSNTSSCTSASQCCSGKCTSNLCLS